MYTYYLIDDGLCLSAMEYRMNIETSCVPTYSPCRYWLEPLVFDGCLIWEMSLIRNRVTVKGYLYTIVLYNNTNRLKGNTVVVGSNSTSNSS